MSRIILQSHGSFRLFKPQPVALSLGTRCPYNSQNTFISRELLPLHFLWPCAGTDMYRYDDIFASYVAQTIIQKHGKTVKFGPPVQTQVRNEHDLMQDLRQEIGGLSCQKAFLGHLKTIDFKGTCVVDDLRLAVHSLVSAIPALPRTLCNHVDTWCWDIERIGL